MQFSSAQVWSFGKRPRGKFKIILINIFAETLPIKKSYSPSPLDYQNINFTASSPNWR